MMSMLAGSTFLIGVFSFVRLFDFGKREVKAVEIEDVRQIN